MLENVKKNIEEDKELLDILPQNNVSNRKKYHNKLKEWRFR